MIENARCWRRDGSQHRKEDRRAREGREASWTAPTAGVLTSIQEIVNALVLPQGREVQVIDQRVQAVLEEKGKMKRRKCYNEFPTVLL